MSRIFKKIICVLLILCFSLLFSSCSGLKLTPEMEESIEIYKEAVSKALKAKKGSIRVVSYIDDDAIEFKTTETTIDFSYVVSGNKVKFDRNDSLNGEDAEVYRCDGKKIEVYDREEDKWFDDTEKNKDYLDAKKNPLVTLTLFRVDNDLKINTSHLSDIKRSRDGDYTVITFTLNDKSVSTVLSYTKAKGIVRESAGHTRSYYIDKDNNLCKIKIDAVQKISSNGKVNNYTSSITVDIER